MIKHEYVYQGTILNVVDGDTVDMQIDLGFNTSVKERFRLTGINSAEMNSKVEEEKKLATEAKAWMAQHVFSSVVIKSTKKDKYGRYLAEIFLKSDLSESLNSKLVSLGLAKKYV